MRKLFVLVMAFFLMVSCAPKKEEKAGEYLMKIGDKVITKEDIMAIPDRERHRYVGTGGIDRFVAEQILYQEALRKGIDKDPEYLKTMEYLRKKAKIETLLDREIAEKIEVTDKEVIDHYNKNKEEFKVKETGEIIPLDRVKEHLRQMLLMKKQRAAYDKYMEDLRKRYNVKINDEAMKRAVEMLSAPMQ